MDFAATITYIIILIMSVVMHETAHGYMADYLGDPTARLAGRLTLNPIKHLDLVGSIILPVALVVMGSPILIGWAKPVPFNPYNFKRHRKWGASLVAIAGPASNMLLALIFVVLLRVLSMAGTISQPIAFVGGTIVLLNIVLAIFNLLPVPPLDGHHILFALIPEKYKYIQNFIQRYYLVFAIILFFFVWSFIEKGILLLFSVLVGPEVTTMFMSAFS